MALDLSRVRRTRTFAPERSKTGFKLGAGSCFQGAASVVEFLFQCMSAENMALYADLGDRGYLNFTVDDIGLARSLVTRKAGASPSMDAFYRNTPTICLPSNHDGSNASGMRGDIYGNVTFDIATRNSKQAFMETVPHYPLAQFIAGETDPTKVILSQSFWIHNVFVIGIDTASQRETGSVLGTYLWAAHKQWVKDRLAYANGLQADAIVILCPNTWNTAKFNSWQSVAPVEQTEICDFIRDNVTFSPVILVPGDMHQGMVDDGTNADKSTGATSKIPMIVCSPIQVASIYDEGICSWNGQVLKTTGVHSLYGLLEFIYENGAFKRWTGKLKGDPIAGTTATTLISVASDDAPNLVSFASSSVSAAAGQPVTIPVLKTWFGQLPGGSQVNWSASNGQSGTLLIGANCNRKTLPALTFGSGGGSVTLSSPVRCGLGAKTTIAVAA